VTDSSTLFLTVKHHTSKPFIKDPCVGISEIVVARLLQMCENNQRKSNISFFFKAGFSHNVQMPIWNYDRTTARAKAPSQSGSTSVNPPRQVRSPAPTLMKMSNTVESRGLQLQDILGPFELWMPLWVLFRSQEI
jgi:hypothetical protein